MFSSGFHLLPFYTASLASGATNVALGTVNDPVVSIQNGYYYLPADMNAVLAYVAIDSPVTARINAPSLMLPFLPQLDPVSPTVLPANMPPLVRFGDVGMGLQGSEQLTIEATRAVATAAAAAAGLWISPRPITRAPGAVRTMIATASVVAAAGGWNIGNMTFGTSLQSGTYQVVGMACYGTNVLFGRLVFSNQTLRPGCLAQQAVGEWNDATFRSGNMGVWGTFNNYTQPLIEIFGAGTTTTQTIYLDLIKVG